MNGNSQQIYMKPIIRNYRLKFAEIIIMILQQLHARKRKLTTQKLTPKSNLVLTSTFNTSSGRFETSKTLTASACSNDGKLLMYGTANGKIQLENTSRFHNSTPKTPKNLDNQISNTSTFDHITSLTFYPSKTSPPPLFLAAGTTQTSKHQVSQSRKSRKFKNPAFVSIFDTATMTPIENFAPWSGDSNPRVQNSTVTCLEMPKNVTHQNVVAAGLSNSNLCFMFDLRSGSSVQSLKVVPNGSLRGTSCCNGISFKVGECEIE